MALPLHIQSCICDPAHEFHFPASDRPLRIQIDGPLTSVQNLVPGYSWTYDLNTMDTFPHLAASALAKLTYRTIYGKDAEAELPVRDEYLAWMPERQPNWEIDYYGVTFDNLVPSDDLDPEVLQINIIELDFDDGLYAKQNLPFPVDASEYTGRRVLAVPRCCQNRRGTTDRARVNDGVKARLGLGPYNSKKFLQKSKE